MGVNIKDLAAAAGVSPATVSLALNDSGLVKAETKERIKELADKMGYKPNHHARSLVKGKSGMLGLIVPSLQNVLFAELVHQINRLANARGYGVAVANSDNSRSEEEKLLRNMSSHAPEGIMLAPINEPGRSGSVIENYQTPILFITSRYSDSKHPCVMSNVRQGMYDLTREVIRSGRKRLVFVTGPEGVHHLDEREAGYIAAADGVTHDIYRAETLDYRGGCAAGEALLDKGYDAILCANDLTALGVEIALVNHGIAVPEQIGVTGFNNIIFSETSAIPITTVEQDIQAIAEQAIESMFELIHEKQCEDAVLECKVVKRRSI